MDVNQNIKPEIVEGSRVVVVKSEYTEGEFYELDETLVGKEGTVIFTDREYTVYQPDAAIKFDYDGEITQVELQHLQLVPVQLELELAPEEKVCGETSATKQPRVNYLYVIEDEDGVYGKTFDRDHAREIKASYGGKKAGVIITAYAAVKEIR